MTQLYHIINCLYAVMEDHTRLAIYKGADQPVRMRNLMLPFFSHIEKAGFLRMRLIPIKFVFIQRELNDYRYE